MMRKNESEYKEPGLEYETRSDDQIIKIMCQYPKLIERPIVINSDNKAAMSRPPKAVLKIL